MTTLTVTFIPSISNSFHTYIVGASWGLYVHGNKLNMSDKCEGDCKHEMLML